MSRTDYKVKPVTAELASDAETTFGAIVESAACFCTWFLIPVAQYLAGGAGKNRKIFQELVQTSPLPVGLLAYSGDEPVGWEG